MRIGILTSSRADYGIYRPLIQELKKENYSVDIIAFGTHLEAKYGMTKNEILNDGYEIFKEINTHVEGDSQKDISMAIANTIEKFKDFYQEYHQLYDLIFCLGDRFEMMAAVISGIPFNLKFAHIHGGEISEGAIDNKFRNIITVSSTLHFCATQKSKENVIKIINTDKNVHNVGALAIDNIKNIRLYDDDEFYNLFNIKLNNPILVTIHPETVDLDSNEKNVLTFIEVVKELKDQIIVSLPNTDTHGLRMRQLLNENLSNIENVHLFESFGTRGYFTLIKNCVFLLGNTSSGLIEAPSFGKYAINLGNRQKGREKGKNVIDCDFDKNKILELINKIKAQPIYKGENIYGSGNTAFKIVELLKQL